MKTDDEVKLQITHDLELKTAISNLETVSDDLFHLHMMLVSAVGKTNLTRQLKSALEQLKIGCAALERVKQSAPWKRT